MTARTPASRSPSTRTPCALLPLLRSRHADAGQQTGPVALTFLVKVVEWRGPSPYYYAEVPQPVSERRPHKQQRGLPREPAGR